MASVNLVMCGPRHYRVAYVINPWMEGHIGRTDLATAERQWENLYERLAVHVPVEVVEPAPDLPDMAFAANAGLVCGETFVPSRMRFPQRRPEEAFYTRWFAERGYRVRELPPPGSFEGEGDALLQPGEALLWGGYGVRTSLAVYRHISELLDVEVVPLRLVDERFYHLDTCFFPLPDGAVVYYPPAFAPESADTIAARVPPDKRYAVSAEEATHFSCNAVVAENFVLTNFASQELRRWLERRGFALAVCPVSEFLLAGGGAKCLVLRLNPALPEEKKLASPRTRGLVDATVELQGHLLDSDLMNRALDAITTAGGTFEIETFRPGFRHDQGSWTQMHVTAPSQEQLEQATRALVRLGARCLDSDEADAELQAVQKDGVAPYEFYSTTIFPTDVRVRGRWVRAAHQRMDAVLVVGGTAETPGVDCRLIRDLRASDTVVCGSRGLRVQVPNTGGERSFEFMSAAVSSERRVELTVARIAAEMRRIRARRGRIVVVAGPVVIHTGGGPHLAALVRAGYVQALLAGNGFAVHDIEQNLFGTSLGVDLEHGVNVRGGHRNHLRAINLVRQHGSIAAAVEHGALRGGVMAQCVRHEVPFALAGSIRDDGPLPDTLMDLTAAQREYARLLDAADMVLMLASTLHAIGVGNMTPGGVRLICVDINPATVTKLADRGSVESTGVVTDAGLFLNLLRGELVGEESLPATTGGVGPSETVVSVAAGESSAASAAPLTRSMEQEDAVVEERRQG